MTGRGGQGKPVICKAKLDNGKIVVYDGHYNGNLPVEAAIAYYYTKHYIGSGVTHSYNDHPVEIIERGHFFSNTKPVITKKSRKKPRKFDLLPDNQQKAVLLKHLAMAIADYPSKYRGKSLLKLACTFGKNDKVTTDDFDAILNTPIGILAKEITGKNL